MSTIIWIVAFLAFGLLGGLALVRKGIRWGSTSEERAHKMPGDDYLKDDRGARKVMTRAISIGAPPERVWSWLTQLGRGAGWYSVDWLDNGRKVSAWHIVSWIPEPRLGDSTSIGYLRHISKGRSMAWWLDDARFLGSRVRLVTCYTIGAEENGTRLISRISADAIGFSAQLFLLAFQAIDSIMARSQLIGLRNRVEYCEQSPESLRDPETGKRDQYQLYEVLYANGESAGVAGKEDGARWRQSAMRDGILEWREWESGIDEDTSAV